MALLRQHFNGAQTFYVDPELVNGDRTCDISYVNLYFKYKPDVFTNLMDARAPGVKVFIAETVYGVPRITRESGLFTGKIAYLPLERIITSSDATAPTQFRFATPVTVETDKEYCFVVIFDMLSTFILWKSVQGEILTGTTSISPGPSNRYVGKYYDSVTAFVAEDSTNLDEYTKNWRAISDTSLKFDIGVARYAHSGVPVGANGSIDQDTVNRTKAAANVTSNTSGINFNVNFGSYEFISFNENKSQKAAFVGGLQAYQNTVPYPGGYENAGDHVAITTVQGNTQITANTLLPNGSNFQWSTIFPAINSLNKVVVSNGTKVNIRTVSSIVSNTVLTVTEPLTFSNTDAKLYITPVGRVSSFNKDSPFGIAESFVMLENSSANSTVRFVNNSIEAVQVTAGGGTYDNSDIFYVTGFENVSNKVVGGYMAVGNVVTNTTGGIDTIYLSNLGCGFVNSSSIEVVIANSSSGNTTANTSAGTGATFTYTIGSTIKTEYGNNNFRESVVRNLDIGEFIPYSEVFVPAGTEYQLKLETNYIRKADNTVFGDIAYHVNDDAINNKIQLTLYDLNSTEPLGETPTIPSKSNEYVLLYEDGSPNDIISSNAAGGVSNSLKIVTDISANSDYSTVRINRPSVQFSKYVINNDATNEHTDSGNAYAKGITNVIDFTRTAEDLRLYLTAYKPANTDIKVYARIYKNEDPEAFDDKNWTELELKDGIGVFSSLADPLDYAELTYGFYQVPQERTILDGVVEVSNNDANLIGSNTTFSTDLAVGDLVYLYQPLFPENHFVAAVEAVTDNTNITVDFITTNNSIIAEGMKIEKIDYPQQAFNNIQNDNLVRYYNSSTSKFDGYESLAVKIVFLSDNPHKIPRVDDMKGTGVSS